MFFSTIRNDQCGFTRPGLLGVIIGLIICINGLALGVYCWPEVFGAYCNDGWQALCGMFGLKHGDFGQFLLMQHLVFIVLDVFLISFAMLLYYDRHVPSDRDKHVLSCKKAPGVLGTVRLQLDLFTALSLVAFSCVALSSLLTTDQAGLFLVQYKSSALVQCCQTMVLFIGCCVVVYVVNSAEKKHVYFQYVSTLQAMLLVLTDVPLYIAGWIGVPIWAVTVLVINLLFALLAPLFLMVLHSHWSRWCNTLQQSTAAKYVRQLTIRNHQDLVALRFGTMLRFLAVSKAIPWWLSNAFGSMGFPETFMWSAGAMAMCGFLTVAWCYLSVQLVIVTLDLERKQAVEYWLPFEGWVLFVLSARNLCTVIYLSYVRFYDKCHDFAAARLDKTGFSPRVVKLLLTVLSISPVFRVPSFMFSVVWPWFGLDERWLLLKGLGSYIGLAKAVHVQYFLGGSATATKTGRSVIAAVGAVFTGAQMVYGGHYAYVQFDQRQGAMIQTEASTTILSNPAARRIDDGELQSGLAELEKRVRFLKQLPLTSQERDPALADLIRQKIHCEILMEQHGISHPGSPGSSAANTNQ